ncbi:unnamed protein product [Oikopleura dioica]|uniref:Sulfotransferase n=1 Tax=Oikopleura dioica TaxID=34765 RepID=E4WU37_OIKDI|nr:unnamed protein product [Oikopleura dioica]
MRDYTRFINNKQKWKGENMKEKLAHRLVNNFKNKASKALKISSSEIAESSLPKSSILAAREYNDNLINDLESLLNSGEKVRLPDVIIVGEKKCGTKALLAFLLEHPQISGFHQEVHLVDTGDIIYDLKALLGHFARINHKSSKFLVTKTGTATINSYLPSAPAEELKKLEEKYLSESFEDWTKRVIFVDLVCDPVKRLLSDFQHYKADHPNARKINEHKFGKKSEFSEMSFDCFVNFHIRNHKNETELVKKMLRTSTFNFSKQLIHRRPNQTVILDGGTLQTEPWLEIKRLKDKIGLNAFFYEKRFGKREDGFWCVKKNTNSDAEDNLVCMPESKGRSKHGKETISDKNKKYLYKAYSQSSQALGKACGRNFSWFENF